MVVKFCEFCGKKFITKSQKKKFCTQKCRKESYNELRRKNEQLCWRCGKACGGCSWSSCGEPIAGWDAKQTTVRDSQGDFQSFRIKMCPEFIEG